MVHGVAVDIQVLQLAQRQQGLYHLYVALLDGKLKGRHQRGGIGTLHALQDFWIADIVHHIEEGDQMGQGPGRILRQGIAGLLQAIHIVVLGIIVLLEDEFHVIMSNYLLDNVYEHWQPLEEGIEAFLGLRLKWRAVQAEGCGIRVRSGSLQYNLVHRPLVVVAIVGRCKQDHGIISSEDLERSQRLALYLQHLVRRLIAAQQTLKNCKE